jgi:hypothetical protein
MSREIYNFSFIQKFRLSLMSINNVSFGKGDGNDNDSEDGVEEDDGEEVEVAALNFVTASDESDFYPVSLLLENFHDGGKLFKCKTCTFWGLFLGILNVGERQNTLDGNR